MRRYTIRRNNRRNAKMQTPADLPKSPVVKFSKEVLDYFRTNVGRYPAETGGMLGCTNDANLIDLAEFDVSSCNTAGTFYYDPKAMNDVYWDWKDRGYISALGFFHSHPHGCIRPSFHDISTARILMNFFHSSVFYMPIFMSNTKNGFYKMFFYTVRTINDRILVCLEYIIDATKDGYAISGRRSWHTSYSISEVDSYIEKTNPQPKQKMEPAKESVEATVPTSTELFGKVDTLVPDNVRNKVIVCIGAGGARSFLENMARHGFNNYIIMDKDIVSASNIATQGVFISEIGKQKTEVIKSRILDINPKANVITVNRFLDNSMSDEEFGSLLNMFPGKRPQDYLILGCTDNFEAQKRSSYLALKFGIPYLAAMVYERGAGCELMFVYPGVTESCPRCILLPRFVAYENGYKNNVGSAECSVFVTERMNSLKGQIALMMLCYHDAPDSPYNNLLDQIADRNFVMIRTSPDINSILGIKCFDNIYKEASDNTFTDEPIWFKQSPEKECKLCGCIHDLSKLAGKWKDTRIIDVKED